ncbi:MAG: addiction module protein [Gemmataceae bacterium]|nr:addiction module protein [Gemmataceae bacterium]
MSNKSVVAAALKLPPQEKLRLLKKLQRSVADDDASMFTDAIKLPVSAKLRLIKKLVKEIESESLDDVDAAWKAEIKRRVKAFESGEVVLHSGDEVLRALKKKYAS